MLSEVTILLSHSIIHEYRLLFRIFMIDNPNEIPAKNGAIMMIYVINVSDFSIIAVVVSIEVRNRVSVMLSLRVIVSVVVMVLVMAVVSVYLTVVV